MSNLTREERGRVAKGFLITTGIVALVAVLFALVGQLSLMTIILGVVGIVWITLSLVIAVSHVPIVVAYAMLFNGIGVVSGALVGNLIVRVATSLVY